MIITTIGPLYIATVWRQFHVTDYAVSPSPLFSSHSRMPIAIMDL